MTGAVSSLYRHLCCCRRLRSAGRALGAAPPLDEKLVPLFEHGAPEPGTEQPPPAAAERPAEALAEVAAPAEEPAERLESPGSEQATAEQGSVSLGASLVPELAEGNWPEPTLAEQHTFLDAAKYYDFGRVRELVLANPRLVNCQPARRWSALHQAAHFGDPDAVRFLLEHGADLQAKTRDGLTPLEVASPSVFDILLEATLGAVEETNEPKGPCTSDATIAGLHVWRFERPERDDGAAASEFQCLVCLQDVAEGDELRSLPCAHFFHVGCIDVWLKERSSSCPTCRFQVV